MLNKFLFTYILILFVQGFSSAQGKIFFDVKTKMSEKLKLTHIKTATEILLLKTDWASVTEIGEEYELWLINFKRAEDEETVNIDLDIEIRTPNLFEEGEVVNKKHIEVSYNIKKDYNRPTDHYDLFKKRFRTLTHKTILETTLVSEIILDEIYYISKSLQ